MDSGEACRGSSRTEMRGGFGGLWVAPKEAQISRDPHRGNPGVKMRPARVCSSHSSVGLTPFWIVLVTICYELLSWGSVQWVRPCPGAGCCCSVTQSCLTLSDPVDCSTPGFPVLHHLPEFAQTHVH